MLGVMLGFLLLLLVGLAVVLTAGTVALVRAMTRPPRKSYGKALAHDDPTDPAELGLNGEAWDFRLSDGTSSPGWVIAGERADGPTTLVLHGFGDSRYGALNWVPLVAAYSRQVVAFDMRGHGESSAKHSFGGMPEAEDALAVLGQLEPRGRFVLLGYSMGAQLAILTGALAAARGLGDQLAGVMADGPYRRWQEPVARTMRCCGYPARPLIWLASGLTRLQLGPAGWFDRVEEAAKLPCPLLVLHGRQDPICPFEDAETICEAADGELCAVPEGGHLDLAAVDAERYRAAIRRFYERLSSDKVVVAADEPG